jgi:hypothetical protein
MRRVLVDGNAVDTGGGEAPALILNNPALANVKELKLNRTTSYNLPATDRNRAALGLVGDVGAVTRFPREYHEFEEYRDGVPVIREGRARVVSVTREAITLSVTWGFPRELKDLLSRKLRDLPAITMPWNSSTHWAAVEGGAFPRHGWVQYDTFGDGTLPEIQYALPSVSAYHLLELIWEVTGVRVGNATTPPFYGLSGLWVPCLTKLAGNASPATVVRLRTPWIQFTDSFTGGLWGRNDSTWTVVDDQLHICGLLGTPSGEVLYPSPPAYAVVLRDDKKYGMGVEIDLPGRTYPYYTAIRVRANGQEKARYRIRPGEALAVSGEMVEVEEESGILWLDVEVIRLDTGARLESINPEERPGDVVQLTIRDTTEEASYPVDAFNITANLPDITCLDLLGALCQMMGLYVTGNADMSITLHRTGDLLDRPSYGDTVRVVDLTRRAITREADTMTYQFADYARVNRFNYAEDETVSAAARSNTAGLIEIDDDTLAAEKEAAVLPFAPCDSTPVTLPWGKDEQAIIPVFVKDPDTGEVKFNGDKLKPRVVCCRFLSNQTVYALFNESMGWPSLLQYQELLAHLLLSPRVVKLKIRVSAVDLLEWSEAVPVFYWRGRHWLYVTITAAADGTADVEMVEIGDRDGNG